MFIYKIEAMIGRMFEFRLLKRLFGGVGSLIGLILGLCKVAIYIVAIAAFLLISYVVLFVFPPLLRIVGVILMIVIVRKTLKWNKKRKDKQAERREAWRDFWE